MSRMTPRSDGTLSLWLAEQTNVWSDRNGTRPTVDRIEVDIDRLFAAFDELEGLYARNRADFTGLKSLLIWDSKPRILTSQVGSVQGGRSVIHSSHLGDVRCKT